jgi:hypothetical protein
MFDLKERIRVLVAEDPTRARDKDVLVRLLSKELKGKEQQVFMLLLTEFVNHHARRPPQEPRGRKPAAASRNAALARAPHQRALIMEQAGKRPLYIPSLVSGTHDGWVAYDDMTGEYWQQYVDSRQRLSRVSASLATWGSQNLQALREYKAASSGKLPTGVRESLLRRMPQSSGRELEGGQPPLAQPDRVQAVTARA